MFTFDSNNIQVNGNSTISVNRNTANGSNNTVAFNSLTIGGQTLTLTSGGNTYRGRFSSVNLTNLATISPGGTIDPDLNNVTDNGAGLGVIKTGAGFLFFNDNPTLTGGKWLNANGSVAFSGGISVMPGAALRFGNSIAASSTAKAGTGQIGINPGGEIQLQALTNINSAAGQLVDGRSATVSGGLARVIMNSDFNPASVLTGTSSGLLLAAQNTAAAKNLGTIGDGTFQFANTGNFTYSATTLGVGAGSTYRLGGNAQNFTITAANTNVLTGTASVRLGSLASTGGTFTFNSTNDYSNGTVIARGITAAWNTSNNAGGANTPLGTGQVDVFGNATANATAAGGTGFVGLFNQNTFNIHPGSTIFIDDSAATSAPGNIDNRWGGGNIALDGNTFQFRAANFAAATSNESFGDLTFTRGTRINTATNTNTAKTVITVVGNFARNGAATMVFLPQAGALLGAPIATSNAQQFIIASVGLQPALQAANLMAPAYYVDATSNQFLTYGADGFADVAYTAGALNLPQNLSTGNDIAQVTGNVTLVDNPVIYALGITTTATISTGAGQFNTITVSGTGATSTSMGGILVGNVAAVINSNIKAGAAGQFELPIYLGGSTTTINGDLSATGITKFGAGTLVINKDQSDAARGPGNGYSGGWVVNEGGLTIQAMGGLGNAVVGNTVTLNGSTTGQATLNLNVQTGNTANQVFTSGKIIAVDNALINWTPNAADRTQTIADVNVQSTGGTALDAQLQVNIPNSRSILEAGVLSITGANFQGGTAAAPGAIINVNASAIAGLTNGISSGFSAASLSGAADSRLTKWGSGVLYVRGDSSATFTGTVSIQQGAIQIGNVNALGRPVGGLGTNVTVSRFGTLDINATGYAGTPTYLAGSIERWSADGARNVAGGTVNLGLATLQIANDQTATSGAASVILNGGALEGYLNQDSNINQSGGSQGAVYRTVGAGYGFQLKAPVTTALVAFGNNTIVVTSAAGIALGQTVSGLGIQPGSIVTAISGSNVTLNLPATSAEALAPVTFDPGSRVGQSITQGANGLDNGVTPTQFTPFANALTGAILEIKGVIGGAGSLTKQGYDTVVISCANTYTGGTYVTTGTLRAGAANVLAAGDPSSAPNRGTLSTTGGGIFDLNGNNQAAGALTSPSQGAFGTATFNQNGSGYVTNTAAQLNTLSIGTALVSYAAVANVTASSNTVTIPVGVLSIAPGQLVTGPGIPDNTTVTGVALTGGGAMTVTLSNNATITSPLNCADLTFTPINAYDGVIQYNIALTKTGSNVQVLNNINTYVGGTTVTGGVLRAVDGQGLPAASNLALNGGVFEAMGGTFTRTLGTGASQFQISGGTSGFSAFGSPLTLNFGALTWGSANFNPGTLVLNAASANAALSFASALDLNATGAPVTRTVGVYNSITNPATITGNLSQSGGGAADFAKEGQGRLIFGNASVLTYAGGTTVNDGVLQTGAASQLPNTLLTVNSTLDGGGCALTTGKLDMFGFSQTVGNLRGTGVNALVTSTNGAATLTAGSDSSNRIYQGTIQDGASASGVVSLAKNGGGTLTLTGTNNSYTGNTTISDTGKLEVKGSLSGTTAVQVNNTGTLLLNSSTNADNIVNTGATFTGNGGTLAVAPGQSGRTQTFNGATPGTTTSMTLSASSTLDFGAGNSDVRLVFGLMDPATKAALLAGTTTLSISNWNGPTYNPTDTADNGATQDHLVFTTDPGFGTNVIPGFSFSTNPGGGAIEVQFGSAFEIVPVPEPSTTLLIGSVALCALIGYRGRRRVSGERNCSARE